MADPNYANPDDVTKIIADLILASATWGGAIADTLRSSSQIAEAQKAAGYEILRAIANNPKHSWYANYQTMVDAVIDPLTGDFKLPAHDGEAGEPRIIPFSGGKPQTGIVCDPDEIDSYLNDELGAGFYSGTLDGTATPHNQPDEQGYPSPISCRYSLIAGRFKFTGDSAQIPLIIISDTMALEQIPIAYTYTIVKLAIPKLVKPGDMLYLLAPTYQQMGISDLLEIQNGALSTSAIPKQYLPSIAKAQKDEI